VEAPSPRAEQGPRRRMEAAKGRSSAGEPGRKGLAGALQLQGNQVGRGSSSYGWDGGRRTWSIEDVR
jgi:hypothetical protein